MRVVRTVFKMLFLPVTLLVYVLIVMAGTVIDLYDETDG